MKVHIKLRFKYMFRMYCHCWCLPPKRCPLSYIHWWRAQLGLGYIVNQVYSTFSSESSPILSGFTVSNTLLFFISSTPNLEVLVTCHQLSAVHLVFSTTTAMEVLIYTIPQYLANIWLWDATCSKCQNLSSVCQHMYEPCLCCIIIIIFFFKW